MRRAGRSYDSKRLNASPKSLVTHSRLHQQFRRLHLGHVLAQFAELAAAVVAGHMGMDLARKMLGKGRRNGFVGTGRAISAAAFVTPIALAALWRTPDPHQNYLIPVHRTLSLSGVCRSRTLICADLFLPIVLLTPWSRNEALSVELQRPSQTFVCATLRFLAVTRKKVLFGVVHKHFDAAVEGFLFTLEVACYSKLKPRYANI